MTNFTGNAEVCIDLSAALLTQLLQLQTGLSATANSSLIGSDTADITYSFTKLVIANKEGRATLAFDVNCTPTINDKKLVTMSGDISLSVPFKISPPANGKRDLILDFTDADVSASLTALTNLDVNATTLGWKAAGYTGWWTPGFLLDLCQTGIQKLICGKAQKILPLTAQGAFSVMNNPVTNGSLSSAGTATFAENGLAVTTLPATASSPGVVCVLGSISLGNISQVKASEKDTAAIDGEHNLGLAVSQKGYHDQIFCPNVAEQLGVFDPGMEALSPIETPLMCPDCGIMGSVSLGDGADLHRIGTTLSEGRAELSGIGFESFTGGSATAFFQGHATFALDDSGNIVPTTTVDSVQLDVSLDWWAVLISVVFLGALPIGAAAGADGFLGPLVKSMLQKRLDSVVKAVPVLPTPLVKFNSIAVHPQAIVLMGEAA